MRNCETGTAEFRSLAGLERFQMELSDVPVPRDIGGGGSGKHVESST